MDWTSLDSLDTWFSYRSETYEVFDLPEGHIAVLSKHRVDDDVILTHRALLASAVCFAFDQLCSMG